MIILWCQQLFCNLQKNILTHDTEKSIVLKINNFLKKVSKTFRITLAVWAYLSKKMCHYFEKATKLYYTKKISIAFATYTQYYQATKLLGSISVISRSIWHFPSYKINGTNFYNQIYQLCYILNNHIILLKQLYQFLKVLHSLFFL